MQFETKLILINHIELSREVRSVLPGLHLLPAQCFLIPNALLPRCVHICQAFFQMAIRRFEVTPRLKLANPVCVREFVRASLDTVQSGWTPEDGYDPFQWF